jgi:hypothetical protein
MAMTETDFNTWTFNTWNDELIVPPVRDSLRLCDYLPAELQAEFLQYSGLPPELLSYTWLLEEHYEKVVRWAKGVVSTGRAKKKDRLVRQARSGDIQLRPSSTCS